jgi:ABC-type multidrug transport system ATPase subunit/ABC-type multidrug transport system permease subunit
MEMTDLENGVGRKDQGVPGGAGGKSISWENVTFDVGEKKILEKVSGSIRPSGLCAIMGPSGAGKSTLLNIIAGRLRSQGQAKVGGSIFVDCEKIVPFKFRKQIAYVMQEDALFATQTPREAFDFSAALRLPSTVSMAERKQLVNSLLEDLALTKCADTLIGSVLLPGISGGEKKRTAIGVELISNPDILFLDEPTSGLDSFSAFQVVNILKKLCATGKTIITTIHQPSSEIFQQFDEVLLLARGRIVYNGPRKSMTEYFEKENYVCPERTNPADFVMFFMQQATAKRVQELAKLWDSWSLDHVEMQENKLSRAAKAKASDAAQGDSKQNRPGFFTQLLWLSKREGKNILRDKRQMGARVGATLFLNGLVGFVFFGSANWSDVHTDDISDVMTKTNTHFASIFQILMASMMGLMQATMLGFPLERPMFLREFATGTYGAAPYFLSKTLVEIPVSLLQTTLVFLCTYWTIGFGGNFLSLVLLGTLLGMVAASMALVVGAVVDSVQAAMQLTPVLFIPQILFSGVFVPISDIPEMLRWVQYVCSLKYAINLVTLAEFHDVVPATWPDKDNTDPYYRSVYGCAAGDVLNGVCNTSALRYNENALLPRNEINPSSAWEYVLVLLGILVVFRFLAILALVRKGKSS